jgi:drug/metabolite transporter (DMT)-like permease
VIRKLHVDRGASFALLAAALFGVSPPLSKALLRGTAPQLLAGLLYLSSEAGLALVWLIQRRARRERDAPWIAGAIAAGGVLGPLFLLLGLEHTSGSSASPVCWHHTGSCCLARSGRC